MKNSLLPTDFVFSGDAFRRAAILARKPRTKDELYLIARKGLGIHLSRRPATEGHSCLLDVAWEIVSRAHLNFLIVGPRGGGKTRLVTTIEYLEGCWGLPELFHVGAITEQAKQGYSYILEYAGLPHSRLLLAGPPLISQTTWRGGARLSIHPGTIQQVSSHHPDFKTFDELERAKPRVVQQFTGMGREGTISVYLSTRETAHGLVQRKMDEAAETGTPRLHFLDIWDTKAPCPACAGAECLLWDDCQGRYKDTDGHRSRAALEQRKLETDEDTWRVQFRMAEPGVQSLVWANFSEENLDAGVEFRPDVPWEVWCDDGVASPRALIFAQMIDGEAHIFSSSYQPHQTQDTAVAEVLAKGYGKPSVAIVMAADASLRQAWHNAQVSTFTVKTGQKLFTRREGANVARLFIQDAEGRRRLKVHPGRGANAVLVKQVRRHYRDEIEPGVFDESPAKHPLDHFPDALAYGTWYHRLIQ